MQMRALAFWREAGFKNKAEALRRAGYGKNVVDQPHKVFGSPVVLRELELQGFDAWGRCVPPQAIEEDVPTTETKSAVFDLSTISQEALIALKAKLQEMVPAAVETKESTAHAYAPTVTVGDIFSAKYEPPIRTNPRYSSM